MAAAKASTPSIFDNGLPMRSATLWCKMRSTASFEVTRLKSASSTITPADMFSSTDSRWALALCRAARLRSTELRASNNWPVMALKDWVRVPSSSVVSTIGRGDRSPSATARVPSARTNSGWASLLAMTKALATAPKMASSSVSVSVSMYMRRRPTRASNWPWYSVKAVLSTRELEARLTGTAWITCRNRGWAPGGSGMAITTRWVRAVATS